MKKIPNRFKSPHGGGLLLADTLSNDASVHRGPHKHRLPTEFGNPSTCRLSVQSMKAARQRQAQNAPVPTADDAASPMATAGVISTYSPAQIRAAYGLPVLPVAGASLTATQAAQLGTGQSLNIVALEHNELKVTRIGRVPA